jgi:hypothetical protein
VKRGSEAMLHEHVCPICGERRVCERATEDCRALSRLECCEPCTVAMILEAQREYAETGVVA